MSLSSSESYDTLSGNSITIDCMDTVESNLNDTFESIKGDIVRKGNLNEEDKKYYKNKIDNAVTHAMDQESTDIDWGKPITMEDIIMGIETGVNDKGGKEPYALVQNTSGEMIKIPLSRGSKLAGLVQLYLELEGESVQFKDQQDFDTRIDKKIGKDTKKAILRYQTQKNIEQVANAPYIQWIESIGDDVGVDVELRKDGKTLDVMSHNNHSTIDLDTGIITIYTGNGSPLQYPAGLYFARKNGKINFPSNTKNNETLQQGLQIIDFFHGQLKKYINNKSQGNTYTPYQKSNNGGTIIEINNGILLDTDLDINANDIRKHTRNIHTGKQYTDNNGNKIDRDTYITFLNDLYTLQNMKDPSNTPSTSGKTL